MINYHHSNHRSLYAIFKFDRQGRKKCLNIQAKSKIGFLLVILH